MKHIVIARREGGAFPSIGGTEALREASPEELRVLLCLIEAGGIPADGAAALARAAGCSTPRVRSALRYWSEVGVLVEVDEAVVVAPPAEEKRPPLRRSSDVVARDSEEIAATIEKENSRGFFEACAQTLGHELNNTEIKQLDGILQEYPFSHDYILTLLAHSKRVAKSASVVRYMERVAHTMLEKNILTVEALNGHLAALERFASEEWKLRRLLGIGERRLGSREREHLERWVGEFGYGEPIIGIAYDIAVNQTGKIAFPYMNKLLTRWHEAGCRTEAEVNALLETERAEHTAAHLSAHTGAGKSKKQKEAPAFRTGVDADDPSATRGSSFRRADYMAAALRRSYGDDGEGEQ